MKGFTSIPRFTYYLAPFSSQTEAIESQSGYREDLLAEQARGIKIEITLEKPTLVTITEE